MNIEQSWEWDDVIKDLMENNPKALDYILGELTEHDELRFLFSFYFQSAYFKSELPNWYKLNDMIKPLIKEAWPDDYDELIRGLEK